jgi:subtilase family serine protease
MLKRSGSQQAALDQLVSQLHTPGHPNYHKWLTPEQFGKQFGPSDQDIATVETWLTGQGFSVTGALPGKQVIEFSGNVGQFRSAFHAQIHEYQVNGESHFANANDPQIPAALAPVVGGFSSLNNFHLKKQAKLVGKAQFDRTTHTATPMPGWTWGSGTTPGNIDFVLAPQDFAIQYDLNPLYTASAPVTGSGQTIAIINDSNININLVNQFRSLFGLPVNPPKSSSMGTIPDWAMMIQWKLTWTWNGRERLRPMPRLTW